MSGSGQGRPIGAGAVLRRVIPVWAALMLLLTATLIGAHVPLHGWNAALALGIAAAKILLVALFFMHLRRPDPLLRLAGSAALLWVGFLFALTFSDVLTRPATRQPATVEPLSADSPAQTTGRHAFPLPPSRTEAPLGR